MQKTALWLVKLRSILVPLLAVFALLQVPQLYAQEALLTALEQGDATSEQFDDAIAAIESLQGLDDAERANIIESLRDGQSQLQSRKNFEAAASEYAAAVLDAPAKTAELRSQLDEQTQTPSGLGALGVDADAPLAELEQALAQEQANFAAIESRLEDLKDRVDAELNRPTEIRVRISQLRSSRENIAAALNEPGIAGEDVLLTQSRRVAASKTLAAQDAELAMLEQELLSHGVRLSLLQAQRDTAARAELEVSPRVELLQAAVNDKVQEEALAAQRAAEAAELAAADKHGIVQGLAEDNAELTKELPERAAATRDLNEQLQTVKNELAEIEQRLARSERRLEVGGLSRVLGSLMIAERRSLPPLSQYRADIRARNRDAAAVGLDRIRVQEQRRELASIDLAVQDLVAEVAKDIDDQAEVERNAREIRQLLLARRDLLLQVENSYGSYLQVLGNLDIEQRRLLDSTDKYQKFLRQNLLWIPSAPIFGMGVVRDGLPAYPQLLTIDAWAEVGSTLASSIAQRVPESVFCLLVLGLLFFLRRPLRNQYAAMSAKVGRLSTDNIGLTIGSLAIMCIRVLPVPFLMFSAAWFLNNASHPTVFTDTVARGLIIITPFLFNVLVFRALSAPGGVFGLHFGWKKSTLDIVRRQLHRLAVIGAPLIVLAALLFLSEVQSDRATLGRIVYIALMIFLTSVIYPLLHPKTGIVADYYERNAGRWTVKLRWIWFGLAVGLPLLLAVVSFLGFLYTSTILVGLMVATFWRVLTLLVIYLVILRWLALARRKLALQIALQEREARRAESAAEPESEQSGDAAPVVEEVAVDLDEVDSQTRKLLRSGMLFIALLIGWNIWSDVLPAFSFLNEVALWSQTATVDGIETVLPVTAADLLLAFLVVIVTVIASRNIPGLLQILILQRLTLAPGSRYAITTLARYVVVTVGTVSVLSLVGWNWSQIQWLVAALSVGLGFGLQEIVANFVAGLIILFERPVRVGDTVTVGQLSGTVSRVRIRATTITDWDRKEILVPNKAFITEQVVNWTLSDPITRIVVPVGVAYGSDAELVQKVMTETLERLPLVLDEPEPRVYFTGFGDSSLDFTIHAYLRQLADRMPMVHDIHDAILKALREHDIEIPFPQRDIHIRSTVDNSE